MGDGGLEAQPVRVDADLGDPAARYRDVAAPQEEGLSAPEPAPAVVDVVEDGRLRQAEVARSQDLHVAVELDAALAVRQRALEIDDAGVRVERRVEGVHDPPPDPLVGTDLVRHFLGERLPRGDHEADHLGAGGRRRQRQRQQQRRQQNRTQHRHDRSLPGHAAYFASGSGRNWKCTTLLGVPLPVSVWNGARVP